jgi:hypothetical protein
MGRGRAKAKQTKVARQLKYGVPTTDLERLQAELAGSAAAEADVEEDLYEDDPYAKYLPEDDEFDNDADRDQP